MTRGFVFGKFIPFHLGHKALIDFGASKCDELIILICASTSEKLPPTLREKWITETYRNDRKVRIITYKYDESNLPNTSESSVEISQEWASEFLKILPPVDVLFTSEPYGEYVSKFMNIKHESFDIERQKQGISGSKIRSSVYDYWDFLPDIVKSYFQKRVVILGTESVGKSTLANYLSKEFRSSLVHEAARDIILDSKKLTIDQLKEVSIVHEQNIKKAKQQLEPVLLIDTDIHITQSYAKHIFGNYLDIPESINRNSQTDLYLYLNSDVPYVQDGSRLLEKERNALDRSHRSTLNHFGIEIIELSGDYEARKQKAVELINDLVNSFY